MTQKSDHAAVPTTAAPGGAQAAAAAQESFRQFFEQQSGSWNSARTYHYVREGSREDSNTTFDVSRLSPSEVDKVLSANGDAELYTQSIRNLAEGFRVSFLTKMESQEELVRSTTDLAFLPTSCEGNVVTGKYYRI
jgi:CpeS-like protein